MLQSRMDVHAPEELLAQRNNFHVPLARTLAITTPKTRRTSEPTSLFQTSPCRLALEGKTMRTRRQVQDRANRAAEPLLLLQQRCEGERGERHSSPPTVRLKAPPAH